MRRYGKWLLPLGLAAAMSPLGGSSVGYAGPFDRDTARRTTSSAESTKARNQQVANHVAQALRSANLTARNVKIRYEHDTLLLTGQILDEAQKQYVTRVCHNVPGVSRVINNLDVMQTARAASPQSGVTPVSGSSIQPAGGTDPATNPNLVVAKKIASALSSAQLNKFKIRIAYQDGVAVLSGNVANPEQRAAAYRAATSVAEVQRCDNRLSVGAGAQAAMPGRPGMGHPGMGRPGVPTRPVSNAMQGPAPAGPLMNPGMPAPVPGPMYAQGAPGGAAPMYSQPNLPDHAWPSYAAYPNSAAITYPTQYSASAWPYIGPFYPYPQVPLGWRRAELEWDDGQWALQFHSKTDRWWWFLNPKHWD